MGGVPIDKVQLGDYDGKQVEVTISPEPYASKVSINGRVVPVRSVVITQAAGVFPEIVMTIIGFRAKETVVKGRLITEKMWGWFETWWRVELEKSMDMEKGEEDGEGTAEEAGQG